MILAIICTILSVVCLCFAFYFLRKADKQIAKSKENIRKIEELRDERNRYRY